MVAKAHSRSRSSCSCSCSWRGRSMSTWQSRRLVHPKTADQYFSKQCQKAETAPEFSWKLLPTTTPPQLVACNRCANSQSAFPPLFLSLSLCWAAPERRSFNYAIFYFRRKCNWSGRRLLDKRMPACPSAYLSRPDLYRVHLYVSMSMRLFPHFWLSFCYHNQTATLWSVTDSASAYNCCCCYTASVATCAP